MPQLCWSIRGDKRIESRASYSNMADFKIALTTTAAQDESLAWLLRQVNADAVHRDKPLPDVQSLLTEILQTAIEDAVPCCQHARQAQITDALHHASPDQWAKIAEVLQLKMIGGDAVTAVS